MSFLRHTFRYLRSNSYPPTAPGMSDLVEHEAEDSSHGGGASDESGGRDPFSQGSSVVMKRTSKKHRKREARSKKKRQKSHDKYKQRMRKEKSKQHVRALKKRESTLEELGLTITPVSLAGDGASSSSSHDNGGTAQLGGTSLSMPPSVPKTSRVCEKKKSKRKSRMRAAVSDRSLVNRNNMMETISDRPNDLEMGNDEKQTNGLDDDEHDHHQDDQSSVLVTLRNEVARLKKALSEAQERATMAEARAEAAESRLRGVLE